MPSPASLGTQAVQSALLCSPRAHIHVYLSPMLNTCGDSVLLNIESTKPSKGSDTINTRSERWYQIFPPTKCPKIFLMISWFLFQVAFRKKPQLFPTGRAAPPCHSVPGPKESLPLLTHHLYSQGEQGGRGGGQRPVLKNVLPICNIPASLNGLQSLVVFIAGDRLLRLESKLHRMPTPWPWANYLISLCPRCCISKRSITTVSILQVSCMN